MARAGRQQRRAARRAQQGEQKTQQTQQQKPKAPSRRARQQQVRPSAQPAKQQTGRPAATAQRGRFVRESWGELKKVEWPGRGQVMQGTIVVLIACAIVGAYLWVADLAFRNFVERVLL